jgi:hypothetical protein
MTRFALSFLLLAGCLPARQAEEMAPATLREYLTHPKTFHEGFCKLLTSADSWGVAHDKFLSAASKGALRYEAFALGITQVRNLVPIGFEGLVSGIRLHKISEPVGGVITVRWCNPEFGFSREFKLVQAKVGKFLFWGLDLAREDLEAMQAPLLAWYRKQKEVAGDQRLVYPPGWNYASINECECTR